MATQTVSKKKKRKVKNTRILSFFSLVTSLCFFVASGYFLYRTSTEVYTMISLKQEILGRKFMDLKIHGTGLV